MNLYERHNYLNKNIDYLISREIIEYDMKSAGFNIIKRFNLLEDRKIEHLETLEKKERQRLIGIYQRNNKDFANTLNEKFVEMRRIFFEANNIQDDDVLSIKKDAIFTLRRCHNTTFDNIEFVEKNIYTSYYNFNRYELYVGSEKIDMKGIDNDKLALHEPYMLDFLFKMFKMMETTSHKIVVNNLTSFISFYKRKQLDINYYRELNQDSLFKLRQSFIGDMVGVQTTDDLNNLDISYNYMNFIVPLIKILI